MTRLTNSTHKHGDKHCYRYNLLLDYHYTFVSCCQSFVFVVDFCLVILYVSLFSCFVLCLAFVVVVLFVFFFLLSFPF